jgi:hypothetical protein
MPSKGVQVYAYVAVPGCQVEFSVPKATIVRNALNTWSNDHLVVDSKNLNGIFDFTGRFTFRVTRHGAELTSQWVDINAFTGNLGDGTMKSMENTPSIIANDVVITYGFYDAGLGVAGLPSSDQCYVTVTPNYANWMATTAPEGSPQADIPFSHLVLPSAHDAGMNSMQNSEALLQKIPSSIVNIFFADNKVALDIVRSVSEDILKNLAPNIIRALAITQKDSLTSLLTIGARYFEFRPAHVHKLLLPLSPLPSRLYFHHGAIPGMGYDQFLHEVVTFLVAHPSEIVVVQLRYDGVPADCARPTDHELQDIVNDALGLAKGSVLCGTLDDMRRSTISQLRSQRKRLIIFGAVDSYGTYTDAAYATLNGDSIVEEFGKLSTEKQTGKPFTVIQCQATATNVAGVVAYSVFAANASTSPLLATKAVCDSKTLPWIRQHALEHLKADELIVVMNDFLDGGTADVAVTLSRQRLG